MDRKKNLRGSNEYWLDMHKEVVEKFKSDLIDTDSYEDFDNLVYETHPSEFTIIMKDYGTRLRKKIKEIVGYFIYGKSKIIYVVGARDSGKSCFSFWLAEQIHEHVPNMKIAYVGVKIRRSILPEWCDNYIDINKVPFGSLVILDELAVQYNARTFGSKENIQLGQLLAIARHKDLNVIAITQDPNMGEINVWRLKDMVVYKRSNTYELPSRDNRRSSKVLQFWSYIKNWLKPTRQEQALFEYQAMERVMLFKYNLPKCWSDELSKAFRFVKVNAEKSIKKKIVDERVEMP